MKAGPRWSLATVVFLVIAAGGVVWAVRQNPPGYWPADRSREEIRRGWEKEREWSDQEFTAIHDGPGFTDAVFAMPVRLHTSISADAVRALQVILRDQLICRHTGSLECYRERFLLGRRNGLDEETMNRISLFFPAVFKKQLPEHWIPEEVFEQFWHAEMGQNGRRQRFQAVALGTNGTLLTIGDVRSETPDSFFQPEEIRRWKAWPGARIWRSLEFHRGKRSLGELIEREGTVKYAEAAFIIRSENGEVWSWLTDWYFDPVDKQWHIYGSWAATSRDRYCVPI